MLESKLESLGPLPNRNVLSQDLADLLGRVDLAQELSPPEISLSTRRCDVRWGLPSESPSRVISATQALTSSLLHELLEDHAGEVVLAPDHPLCTELQALLLRIKTDASRFLQTEHFSPYLTDRFHLGIYPLYARDAARSMPFGTTEWHLDCKRFDSPFSHLLCRLNSGPETFLEVAEGPYPEDALKDDPGVLHRRTANAISSGFLTPSRVQDGELVVIRGLLLHRRGHEAKLPDDYEPRRLQSLFAWDLKPQPFHLDAQPHFQYTASSIS